MILKKKEAIEVMTNASSMKRRGVSVSSSVTEESETDTFPVACTHRKGSACRVEMFVVKTEEELKRVFCNILTYTKIRLF